MHLPVSVLFLCAEYCAGAHVFALFGFLRTVVDERAAQLLRSGAVEAAFDFGILDIGTITAALVAGVETEVAVG